MGGSIFVLDNNNTLNEMREAQFDNEVIFQELIERYPSILAGEQINPDNPCKWIFISREMGVPSQQDGNAQWFLDHLFIDQESVPTFVEVKRSTDTRVRREVVAQMLDYAANATAYWPLETIRNLYDEQIEAENTRSLRDIGIEEDKEESFWQSVALNLKAGKIRLLFVADEIPHSLQRIIEFLNNQMTETEVLGLEIKQYISQGGMKTLVPQIIGRTASAVAIKRPEQGGWDESSFLEEVRRLSGDEAVLVSQTLLRKAVELECRLWWGKGRKHASVCPVFDTTKHGHSLFFIYSYNKSTNIEIQFQNLKYPFNSSEWKYELKAKLERLPGIVIPENKLDKRPSFSWDVLKDPKALEQFLGIFEWYINELKTRE